MWIYQKFVQWMPYRIQYSWVVGSIYRFMVNLIYRQVDIQPTPIIETNTQNNGITCPFRTLTGYGNNVNRPDIGTKGQPFGFNCPLSKIKQRDFEGISRVVKLLDRTKTQTTDLVNLIGGAWSQFMVHDWFNTRTDTTAPTNSLNLYPTIFQQVEGVKFAINDTTHWWDGSQIYGDTAQLNTQLRDGPYFKLKGAYIPLDDNGMEITGETINFWSGIGFLHNLMMREHNYIVDQLKTEYPKLTDEIVYNLARLILSATVAKIHTIEWTTAILQIDSDRLLQYIIWYGLKGTLDPKLFPKTVPIWGERGIYTPSPQGFSHTHEFVSVYRMHPLIPDTIDIYDHGTSKVVKTVGPQDLIFEKSPSINLTHKRQLDFIYSLGMNKSGSLSLHNYPTFLRNLTMPDGRTLDMAMVEIYRDRERSIQKYNDFRETFLLKRFKSFEELTTDSQLVTELKQAYPGGIDDMDALVGFWLEPKPDGMLFGETIYAVFTTQTPRRTYEDRFLSEYFTAEHYTDWGIKYTDSITMSQILIRHYPELTANLTPLTNPFIPWNLPSQKLYEKVFDIPGLDTFVWKSPV
jgi:hypothetical protein